jgi:hypothetical protein
MLAPHHHCVLFLADCEQALVYELSQFLSGSQSDLVIVVFPLNFGQCTIDLVSQQLNLVLELFPHSILIFSNVVEFGPHQLLKLSQLRCLCRILLRWRCLWLLRRGLFFDCRGVTSRDQIRLNGF